MISKQTITEVNNRLDAVSIVGDYVRLENKSGRWWGRCPFHGGGQEKTPSFKVEPDLKVYNCFGCQKGGSIINFIMDIENLTFPEAIKNIANKIGIEIKYDNKFSRNKEENEQDNTTREELYELYRRTTTTFQHFLTEKPEGQSALKYITDRGIIFEMIEQFKLGFSPEDRNFLYKFLSKKGYSEGFLEKSGLFSAKYKTIPLFSGRIMFPIMDRQGRIVAFGGRAQPGAVQKDGKEPPKYINSPETDIYKKRQTLFAIDMAKPMMRQTKTVYLVEGYIDVIAMHQAGITNTVAPLGTAFTDEQALWLRRWVEKIILIFDNDEAGQKAAFNAILTCRKNGISCSLTNIQDVITDEKVLSEEEKAKYSGEIKDPAEILHKFGAQILKNILKFIINDFEYLISRGRLQQEATGGDVNSATRFMFPYLDALDSEVDRSDYITRIANFYKVERDAVKKDYSEWKTQNIGVSRYVDERQVQTPENQIKRPKLRKSAELSLLTIVSVNMELYKEFRSLLEIKEIEERPAKEIFIALEECYVHDENGIDSLLSRIKDEELRNYIVERGTSGEYKGYFARRLMEDGIKKIKNRGLEKRITEINAQLHEIERTKEGFHLIDDLLEEKKLIDSKIRNM